MIAHEVAYASGVVSAEGRGQRQGGGASELRLKLQEKKEPMSPSSNRFTC